jgi:hypothetical protein
MKVLTNQKTKSKVSSVLNKSSMFVSKNMFDEREETCWNSDQGLPQTIIIDFEKLVVIDLIRIMFQGGFACPSGHVEIATSLDNFQVICNFNEIEDSNELQSIFIPHSMGRYLKINFTTSTDFYGRIIVYKLQVIGEEFQD